MSSRSNRDRRSRLPTPKQLFIASGLLLFAVLGLALLALPLVGVPGDAQAARADVTKAMSALEAGDLDAARESVAGARGHIDSARDSVDGLGGDVWSVLPVAGTAVDDVRHLVDAIDDAVAVAEVGVQAYPSVVGRQATLFRDQQMDLGTLDDVIVAAREAGAHLRAADASLAEVEGSTPFIGDSIAAKRDQAAAQISPMAETWSDLEPMLDELPAVFGADGRRTYLIAMLNPAELRYSGGAALTFAPMHWEDGKVELAESLTPTNDPQLQRIPWRKVRGNPFHNSGATKVVNATFAPSWSVSGEELLRAWRSGRGERHDGVVAVDVVALSRLFGVTGGISVPGYGRLTAGNLVETLIGRYDDYYPDPTAQDALSEAIIPAFTDRLFGGGDYLAKAQALGKAADGRHFALYFRDSDVQQGFGALGLAGDLTQPDGDYLGVFTQNTNIGKTDYWQRRSVSLDVTLDQDGTAANRLDVLVHNDTPPYAHPGPDPRTGYYTRWAGMALSVFLPDGVEVGQTSLRGETVDPRVRNFYDHNFVAQSMLLEPSSTGRLRMDYRVPGAASVDESGDLTYRLALDPQSTVIPGSAEVKVHLPDGYRPTVIPTGWHAEGGTLTFETSALDSRQEWEIMAEPTN